MVTRNVGLSEAQDELVRALVEAVRDGLTEGLAQAGRGDFAEGSGADAVRRVFRAARKTA